METFTATVGKKPSAAASYVHDVDEVQEFLDGLVKVGTRVQKYNSSIDLRELGGTPMVGSELNLSSGFMLRDSLAQKGSNGGAKLRSSVSVGNFLNTEPIKISANLNEFLGTIEDEEDENNFF